MHRDNPIESCVATQAARRASSSTQTHRSGVVTSLGQPSPIPRSGEQLPSVVPTDTVQSHPAAQIALDNGEIPRKAVVPTFEQERRPGSQGGHWHYRGVAILTESITYETFMEVRWGVSGIRWPSVSALISWRYTVKLFATTASLFRRLKQGQPELTIVYAPSHASM